MDSSSERGSFLYVAKTPPEHTFFITLRVASSIKQHGVPAWPVGRLMDSQHGLLVVQGSITPISLAQSISCRNASRRISSNSSETHQ